MSVFSYRTIEKPSDGIFKEKGSKFLAFAYPVSNEQDIRMRMEELKKEYFDARHHCFAWMLGPEKKLYRAFDDGEPNHSAGDPILGQIRSKDLTDILIVVVRYFGGTKLGVGGLISAYKTAAADALDHAVIIERQVLESFTITFDYAAMPNVMRLVKEYDLHLLHQNFSEPSTMDIQVTRKQKESLVERIKRLNASGIMVDIKGL